MRENRTSGSEGRESETNRTSLPLFCAGLPGSDADGQPLAASRARLRANEATREQRGYVSSF